MTAYRYYFVKLNDLKHTCDATILSLILIVLSQKIRHYFQTVIEDVLHTAEFMYNE